nr:PREDICTED: uncharacterized protein LOC109036313 [Bemisia tabaci]
MMLFCATVVVLLDAAASVFASSVSAASAYAPTESTPGAAGPYAIDDPRFCLPYDPDADLPTPRIILRHGYPAEKHIVKTEDGYLLEVHRIPHGKTRFRDPEKPPILLQHGLLGSSSDFIINGPEKSYAYILADLGYDVWLGNCRGNTYSKHHVKLDPKSNDFWNFSFHEMGEYDLPAVIDFILMTTGHRDLLYMGHSMGTTMFFVMASTKPEYNEKIRAQFSLAPVAFMSRAKTPVRYLAPFADDYMKMIEWIGTGEFLGHTSFMKKVFKYMCEFYMLEEIICEQYIFVLTGFDRDQFNRTLLPVILGHTPAGASTKTLVHYAQEIASAKFRPFDYGPEENLVKYGTKEPVDYDLSKITTPVSLYHSLNDLMANEQDVTELQKRLPNVINSHQVEYPQFNHLDFLWATDIRKLIMDRVLSDVQKVTAFDFTPYESFYETFSKTEGASSFNVTNLIDSLISARHNSSVELGDISANFPEEVRSSKLVQAFLINKLSAEVRHSKEELVDPALEARESEDVDVEYDDAEEQNGPHATLGPLQLSWKKKAAKAVKFYDRTVQIFKAKLAKYERTYHRNLEKIDNKMTNVKEKFSKINDRVGEHLANVSNRFVDVGSRLANVSSRLANVGNKIHEKYNNTAHKLHEKYNNTMHKFSHRYDNTVSNSLSSIKAKIADYERFFREKYNIEAKKQAYDDFIESMRTKAKEIEQKFMGLPRKVADKYNDFKSYVKKDRTKEEISGSEKKRLDEDGEERLDSIESKETERKSNHDKES